VKEEKKMLSQEEIKELEVSYQAKQEKQESRQQI